jgi:hypothetical protein
LRAHRLLWLAGLLVVAALVVVWLSLPDAGGDDDTMPPPEATGQAPDEAVGRRLLRTIQLGVSQGLSVDEIGKIADASSGTYEIVILARAALLVLHRDDKSHRVAFEELLDRVLNNLARQGNIYQLSADLPEFHGKDLVLTMVYAMVMTGNQDRATDLLEKHLSTGSAYKQAVALQALRNIGTPRAIGLIQNYAEAGQDKNLAQTTLADEDYPVLFELHDRWNLVPPRQRTRDKLLAMVQNGCSERAAMASYWLGFFPPHANPDRERAELDALKAVIGRNKSSCKMIDHIIALKSLALRSPETVDYWAGLARETDNVWDRHQIVINGFGRWGRQFAAAALDLLRTEPAQYVQWELMQGNLQTRQGHRYRDYWDIWIPVNILVLLKEGEDGRNGMDKPEMDALLSWLEAGARPRDPWVANHMLYNLAGLVSGDDARRLLALFNAHPQRNDNWWIIGNLSDPNTLPLLRYWVTLPAPQTQVATLQALIERLQASSRLSPASRIACCQPTQACLTDWLARPGTSAAIHSEDEAQAWFAENAAAGRGYTIEYRDPLKRLAVIRRQNGTEERWEYLYDCWRNIARSPIR